MLAGATLASAHAQPATRETRERPAAPSRAGRTPPSRHLIGQLATSVDAGDAFATPGGRRHLRRMPDTVAVQLSSNRDATLRRLTGRDGALAGYTEARRIHSGISLLKAPAEHRARGQRDPGLPIETLTRARQTRDGASVNPVFIDPKTGLRLIATRQLVVRLKPGVDAGQHFGAAWENVQPLWGTTDQFILTLPQGTAEEVFAEVDRQSALPGVEWAEPDFIQQVVRAASPNDTFFNSQWHLQNTGQSGGAFGADAQLPGAWDLTTGRSNIVIAILDDGVQLDHPDLAANIFTNTGEIPNNGFDDDRNGIIDDYQGYNFVFNLSDSSPYSFEDNHGTAVAGLAAAVGNNGLGTVGAAYGCRILPVKVLEGEDSATTSDFARALRYSAGLNSIGNPVWHGADVLNISLTFGQGLITDVALADVATKGRNGRGCAVFVAAGNSAAAWEPVEYEVTQAGTYTLRWEYSKDEVDIGSVGADTVWIDSLRYPDDTVETFENGFPSGWITSSFSPWSVVTDGVAGNLALTGWNGFGSRSLRAGPITHRQTNFVECTKFLTPGKLIFWAWVSSEFTYDYFDFWVGRNGTDTLIFSQSGVPILDPIVGYPANNANTIAVGASTDFDYRADYSQYGTQLDFLAPSDGGAALIVTTDRTGLDGYNDGDYAVDFGGTSAATPLSTGVAALALSINPYLTAADIRSLLRGTCDQIGEVGYNSSGRNLYYGSGRISATRAVSESRPDLRVTLTAPDGTVNAGDSMTYSIHVRNIGFSRSGVVTVTNPLPAGFTFVSAVPSPTSQTAGRLTFTSPGVVSGATWTINVTVATSVAGSHPLVAGASTDVPETSTLDNVASGTVPILPLPEIQISDAQFPEGDQGKTIAAVPITLSNPSSRTVTVFCEAMADTALLRRDFAPLKTRVTFAPGETTQSVFVKIVGDTRHEADETFTLQLQDPSNAVLANSSARITILNDDPLPVVSAPDVVRKEGNAKAGKAMFKFSLSAPSGQTITVDYATVAGTAQAGSDFIPTNGVLIFPEGKRTANVIVLVPGEKVLEDDETFLLALSNPVNVALAANAILCTIINNDRAPKAFIDDTSILETDSGSTNVNVTVRLASPSELPVTLLYATFDGTAFAGTDYRSTNGVITFNPGETTQSVSIAILGDTLAESDEFFFVQLSDPTNAIAPRKAARVTITNDDFASSISGSINETIFWPPFFVPPSPPVLQGRMTGDTLALSFLGTYGVFYSIEFTDRIDESTGWQDAPGPLLFGTGERIEITVPVDKAKPQQFYRVRAR